MSIYIHLLFFPPQKNTRRCQRLQQQWQGKKLCGGLVPESKLGRCSGGAWYTVRPFWKRKHHLERWDVFRGKAMVMMNLVISRMARFFWFSRFVWVFITMSHWTSSPPSEKFVQNGGILSTKKWRWHLRERLANRYSARIVSSNHYSKVDGFKSQVNLYKVIQFVHGRRDSINQCLRGKLTSWDGCIYMYIYIIYIYIFKV